MIFNDNILDFISENYNRKDLFDLRFLENFRKVLVRELGFIGELRRIENTSLLFEASTFVYDIDKKIIEISKKDIMCSCKNINKTYGIDLQEFLRFYFFQCMLHENVHILQSIMFRENLDNSVKNQIISHSIMVNNGDVRLKENYILPEFVRGGLASYLYKRFYDYFPEEREAQCISFEVMLKFYEKMFPLRKKELNLLNQIFADEMFVGYEDIENGSSLVKKFYHLIRREDIFNSFDFNTYTSHERYLYGMPLSLDELLSEEAKLGIRSGKPLEKSLTL